jgi:hypothetical protein
VSMLIHKQKDGVGLRWHSQGQGVDAKILQRLPKRICGARVSGCSGF